jgi:predicted RND superfamily exporter protein
MGPLVSRYVRALERRGSSVFAIAALLVAASIYLAAFHLPVHADFADLLPADAPSVRAVNELASRMPAKDTMLMLIVAPDAQTRAAAAQDAMVGMQTIGPALLQRVEATDDETRSFLRAHRFLYVPLDELTAARDALARQIARSIPLLMNLEEDTAPAKDPALTSLQEKARAAEEKLARSAYVSADGKTQVLILRTSFRATDVARDRLLQDKLDALEIRLRAAHPSIEIGFTGGVTAAVAEHAALLHGMLLSSLFVAVLVVLVLFLHLRSIRVLILLSGNILAATVVSFGLAAVTVGHLNAATAFLGAIIAGNGVNYGILLVARFLEERETTPDLPQALANAMQGTLRPTLIASLGASIAYGALAFTHFRGFADFAAIGSLGMVVCWIASFVLLPALLLRFPPAKTVRSAPLFGVIALRLFGFRRPAIVCAVVALASLGAGAIALRYFAHDPFEYDMTQLRSRTHDALESRRWMRISDESFGHGLAGVGGQTFLAVDDPSQLPALVDALKHLQARDPDSIVGPISSSLDAVPLEQPQKLAVLAQLRSQIDQIDRARSGSDRSLHQALVALRPPDELREITAADLPAELSARITEQDGRIGRVVSVRPGASFNEWSGRDLIHFAEALRSLKVPGNVLVAGTSLLFADVLTTIRRDGPRVTWIAALGLLALVISFSGFSRRAVAVLASTFAGSLFMTAACALCGLKINFLDFVALPITLGLGVDYAINVAERMEDANPIEMLRSTGGTVLVCSLTTVIGYASLLVSDNLAIRGFGIASLLGELTCVSAVLVLVPALMIQKSVSRVAVA